MKEIKDDIKALKTEAKACLDKALNYTFWTFFMLIILIFFTFFGKK